MESILLGEVEGGQTDRAQSYAILNHALGSP